MRHSVVILWLVVIMTFLVRGSAMASAETIELSKWQFKGSQDLRGAEMTEFNDRSWETVNTPHSWVKNTSQKYNKYKAAWYRSTFSLSESKRANIVYLFFERASLNSTVYCNGQEVGKHRGGYTSFIFEITDYVHWDKPNLVAVKLSNAQDLRAMPANSHGGLWGRVQVIVKSPIHIDPTYYAASGVFITPQEVSVTRAALRVKTLLRNRGDIPVQVHVKQTLFGDDEQPAIPATHHSVQLAAQGSAAIEHVMDVENPTLWVPEKPYLYSLKTEVFVDDVCVDTLIEKTGIRKVAITEDDFFLNDSPLKLYGACYCHPTNETLGAALTDEALRFDLDVMKNELGFNAVRFSHWPFPKAAYQRCDEIGLISMVENGYAWHEDIEIGPEGDRQVKEMIYQAWNHPSIAFWSSGNENPHPGYYHYAQVIRATDQSRIVTCNDDQNDFLTKGEGVVRVPNKHHDAVFQNKYHGWRDSVTPWDYESFFKRFHLIGEIGGGSLRTNHQPYFSTDFQRSKFEPEEWLQLIYEAFLQTAFVTQPDDVDALFIWQYRDIFSSKYKGYNTKGLFAAGQFKKDTCILYQSFIRPETPIMQIVGKHWYVRRGEDDLKVYGNSRQVRLTVNGQNLEPRTNGQYRHQPYGDRIVNNVFYWQDALRMGRNNIHVEDEQGNVDSTVIYLGDKHYNLPSSHEYPIKNLSSTNPRNKAVYIDMSPQDNWPVYLCAGDVRQTGEEADNTYMRIPEILHESTMIVTKRQSDPKLISDITFEVTKSEGLTVYVMTSGTAFPPSLKEAGFVDTGVVSRWRDNNSVPVACKIYRRDARPRDELIIQIGSRDWAIYLK